MASCSRISLSRAMLSLIAMTIVVSSCSDSMSVCSQAVSVPSFTIRFQQGIDNFSEDQYENLRLDTLRTRETVVSILELFPTSQPAAQVLTKIDDFIVQMELSGWDVSVALSSREANDAADVLGSTETIIEANEVDALVIDQCGLPSTFVVNNDTVDTLPMPWIPLPTDTEPESNAVDDASDSYAIGEVVATLFQLTLTVDEVSCLGAELDGVVDKSDATSNAEQYVAQFQQAFDACEIEFEIPAD